jgi:hypothetical protein
MQIGCVLGVVMIREDLPGFFEMVEGLLEAVGLLKGDGEVEPDDGLVVGTGEERIEMLAGPRQSVERLGDLSEIAVGLPQIFPGVGTGLREDRFRIGVIGK